MLHLAVMYQPELQRLIEHVVAGGAKCNMRPLGMKLQLRLHGTVAARRQIVLQLLVIVYVY